MSGVLLHHLRPWLLLSLVCCTCFRLSAAVTSGVNLNFTADSDPQGDSTWDSNVQTGFDFDFFTNVSANNVIEADNPGITKTYAFPTSFGTGANNTNLQDFGGSNDDATFEIWFKSDDHSGEHILYETGGSTDGFQISVSDNWVIAAGLDNGTDKMQVAAAVEDMTDRHHQVVVTLDFNGSGANLSLYYDGQYQITDLNDPFADFSGTDNAGLGRLNGGSPLSGSQSFTAFNGNIAIFRYYHNKVFTAQEVLDNYNAISTATAGNVLSTDTLDASTYVVWDAHNPGVDSGNTWSSNEISSSSVLEVGTFGDWTLAGGTKPVLTSVTSNNFDITQAYYFDGSSEMTMTADWLNSTTNSVLEIWFKPSDLAGDEVLWEGGGATDGSSFVLSGANLFFYAKDGSAAGNVSYDISEISDDFIKAAAFADLNNNKLYLYVNNIQVDSVSFSDFNDYVGTDSNALGGIEGAHGAALSGYTNFTGYISLVKSYSSNKKNITQSEIATDISTSFQSGLRPRGLIFSIE